VTLAWEIVEAYLSIAEGQVLESQEQYCFQLAIAGVVLAEVCIYIVEAPLQ
jgi:hypothetical protein